MGTFLEFVCVRVRAVVPLVVELPTFDFGLLQDWRARTFQALSGLALLMSTGVPVEIFGISCISSVPLRVFVLGVPAREMAGG